uniref:Uncharacterized protein n=1 Tax=viral metagenome TaxID=1070528 RepID=A0A6C0L2H1_9ZZZZ
MNEFIDTKVMFLTLSFIIGLNYISSDNNIILKKNIK